jgi:hypothetical protein
LRVILSHFPPGEKKFSGGREEIFLDSRKRGCPPQKNRSPAMTPESDDAILPSAGWNLSHKWWSKAAAFAHSRPASAAMLAITSENNIVALVVSKSGRSSSSALPFMTYHL